MMTRRHGKVTVQALPMRVRDQVIGALNLFRATRGPGGGLTRGLSDLITNVMPASRTE